MVKRLKVGLIYSYNEGWIGGSYYIQNLIKSLNLIADELKPELIIYANDIDYDRIRLLGYPYIQLENYDLSYTFFEKVINKIHKIFYKRPLIDKRPSLVDIDVLFPLMSVNDSFFSRIQLDRRIYWIPDFQDKYYSSFFEHEELESRDLNAAKIALLKSNIVFSSKDVFNDFKYFYPNSTIQSHILNFNVVQKLDIEIDINKLLLKFNINRQYFFMANQFWKHKNHMIVLMALIILKQKGYDPLVVMTGKEDDYRNPGYFKELQDCITENNLENNIAFLGFIDRNEQLLLMKNAISVIQPSLFEGWSTVVEDAKSLSKNIILSSLKVHKEQINENVKFFDPTNKDELALIMEDFINNNPLDKEIIYEMNTFGLNFMDIVRNCLEH